MKLSFRSNKGDSESHRGFSGAVGGFAAKRLSAGFHQSFVSGMRNMPISAFSFASAGWSAFDLGSFHAAGHWFQATQKMHPDRVDGFYGAALVAQKQENWLKLKHCATRMMRIDPEFEAGRKLFGIAVVRLGEWQLLEQLNDATAWFEAGKRVSLKSEPERRFQYIAKASRSRDPHVAEAAGNLILGDVWQVTNPKLGQNMLAAIEKMEPDISARCILHMAVLRVAGFAERAMIKRMLDVVTPGTETHALLLVSVSLTEVATAHLTDIEDNLKLAHRLLSTEPDGNDPLENTALATTSFMLGDLDSSVRLLAKIERSAIDAGTPTLVPVGRSLFPGARQPVIPHVSRLAVQLFERQCDRERRLAALCTLVGIEEHPAELWELSRESAELMGEGVTPDAFEACFARYGAGFVRELLQLGLLLIMPRESTRWVLQSADKLLADPYHTHGSALLALAYGASGKRSQELEHIQMSLDSIADREDPTAFDLFCQCAFALKTGNRQLARAAAADFLDDCVVGPYADRLHLLHHLLLISDPVICRDSRDAIDALRTQFRPAVAEVEHQLVQCTLMVSEQSAAELLRRRGTWAYATHAGHTRWYRTRVHDNWQSVERLAPQARFGERLWPSAKAPELKCLSDTETLSLSKNDIALFAKLKDEKARLEPFLAHYRRLGVDRFFFVDNGSTDGTIEQLLEQPDCVVYSTSGSLILNSDCVPWINGLISELASESWCVSVDLDEHLDFRGSESEGALRALRRRLIEEGADCLSAFLIDMYPENPQHLRAVQPGEELEDQHCWFDADYQRFGIYQFPYASVTGGMRARLHPTTQTLYVYKVPFFNASPGWRHLSANHDLEAGKPSAENGVLRHFKFAVDDAARSEFDEYLWSYNRSVSATAVGTKQILGPQSVKLENSSQFDALGYYSLIGRKEIPPTHQSRRELMDTGMIAGCGELENTRVLSQLAVECEEFDRAMAEIKKSGERRIAYLNTPGILAVTFDENLVRYVDEALGEPWVMWGANIRRGVPNQADHWHKDVESEFWRCLTVVIGIEGCTASNSTRFVTYSHGFEGPAPDEHDFAETKDVLSVARVRDSRCKIQSFDDFGNGKFYGFDAAGWHAGPADVGADRLMLYMHFHPARAPRIPLVQDFVSATFFDEPCPYVSRFDRDACLNDKFEKPLLHNQVNAKLALTQPPRQG